MDDKQQTKDYFYKLAIWIIGFLVLMGLFYFITSISHKPEWIWKVI